MESPARRPVPATDRNGTPVVRSALRSRAGSRTNRMLARQLAWDWVGARWPRLLPSPYDREKSDLHCALPGRRLAVATSDDGRVWALEVAYTERDGTRTWRTQATVTDAGDVDVIGLETSCSSVASAPLVIAPPKLLGAWVQHLQLDDGELPVLGEPRTVDDEEQLASFSTQLLSASRSLPVIALTNKPGSRYYGVDPRGLAEAVRGVAHVTCFTPEMAVLLARRLPSGQGPAPGAARIYRPGFSATAARGEHPLVRDASPSGVEGGRDQGAFRRLLCRQVCAMSVAVNPGPAASFG